MLYKSVLLNALFLMRVVYESRRVAAQVVRDNRSPMQAPVGRAALGEVAPHECAPVRRSKKLAVTAHKGDIALLNMKDSSSKIRLGVPLCTGILNIL